MKKTAQYSIINISCIIVIISFFFNWLSVKYYFVSAAVSAFDIVFSDGSIMSAGFSSIIKFILFLCPAAAGSILYFNIKREAIYPVNGKFLFSIPLMATVIFYLSLHSRVADIRQLTMGLGNGISISVTGFLGAGFYICLLVSAYLAYRSLAVKKSVETQKDSN